jgi:hypothetical protein
VLTENAPHLDLTLDGGVVININIGLLQDVMELIKLEPNSDSEMYVASSEIRSQQIYVKQEETPPFMSFEIKTEHEVSSLSSTKHFVLILLKGAANWSWLCS